jgi:exodeoxyribonuclease-3
MKLISWNVNGLKACINKGFFEFFNVCDADFFCLQETKISPSDCEFNFGKYCKYWSHSEKKGYSGVAIFSKKDAMRAEHGMGFPEFDSEGRLITLEFDNFYLINVYTPNAKRSMYRLDFRMDWDDAFKNFAEKLNKNKPIIICGDLNAVEFDAREKLGKFTGFGSEECENFSYLLDSVGLVDTFKHLHPLEKSAYTWRSYTKQKNGQNSGCRIDYFLISNYLIKFLKSSQIFSKIQASDHFSIGLEIDITC